VDGRFPEQLPPILNIIASLPVGSTVKLVVKRGEQTIKSEVVTEKLESRQGEEWAFEKWGLTVRKVSRAYARENQLDDDTGLLVIGVQSGFPAAVAGLGRGDVITKINRERVVSLELAKQRHAEFVANPAPTLLETETDRRVSLYILKP
jgi:serine protease Do